MSRFGVRMGSGMHSNNTWASKLVGLEASKDTGLEKLSD